MARERPQSRSPRQLRVSGSKRRPALDWLRTSRPGLVVVALLIGIGGALGAIAFHYLIFGFTELFTGTADYSDAGGAGHPALPGLGPYFVVAVPVVGGLIYGPLVNRFAPEARGHGVPEVMYAVAERSGRIPPRVAVVKSLASALCIGSGGSVGREGPIVQIGSALGSSFGQLLRVPESRLRLLVACGAAAGISATFNAPIAGVFFALELILRNFEAEHFGVVVLASVTADVVARAVFGVEPFLDLPAFELGSPFEFLGYAVLGILAAGVGVAFTKVLYGVEDVCDRVWRGPEWLRPAAGGVLLGLLLLVLPQMYGVGYPILEAGIDGSYAIWFLLVLMAGKVFATSLTIGIGGSGGVFAPSLFIGGMLGTAFGTGLNLVSPELAASPGAFGLVGMGAVFAGAARAPITAVLIVFELTGMYSIVLPLMAAIVLAAGVSNLVSTDTIYTLKLRRRGVVIDRPAEPRLRDLTVAEVMGQVPAPVSSESGMDELIERFDAQHRDAVPVVDSDGTYRGTVLAREVERSVTDEPDGVTAGDLARVLPALHPGQDLPSALDTLLRHVGSGLPVLAADGNRVVGWLEHRDVLRAYAARRRGADEPPSRDGAQ